MICVSIVKRNFSEIIEIIPNYELAEIRLDQCPLTNDEIIKLFSTHRNLIATCRPGHDSDKESFKRLCLAVDSGALMADVNVTINEDFLKELKKHLQEKSCSLILSYHDFEKTPDEKFLYEKIQQMLDLGADILKIACKVNHESDCAKILSLYHSVSMMTHKKLIALGMGDKGRITRLAAQYVGAPFTFAAFDKNALTAPGQYAYPDMLQIIDMIENKSTL